MTTKNVEYARKLRKEMTPWERKLWYCFLKQYPVRFQRQKTMDHYIVDFFCAKANLIIELDGSGHYDPEKQKKDEERTNVLEIHGYKVLRFCNRDIDKNFYGVCSVIDREVKQRMVIRQDTPPVSSADSPLKEGAKAKEYTQGVTYD